MRAARRDNFRATVFRCSTPLVVARCNSGCARLKADCAAALSPVASALSTFLTNVRTRLSRERLTTVRFSVCRRRFSADLWCGIGSLLQRECGLYRRGPQPVNRGGSAWRGNPRRHQRFLSAVLEGGFAFRDERRHALLLVLGRKGRMEEAPFEAHAFGERRLVSAVDRLLDHHRDRPRHLTDPL